MCNTTFALCAMLEGDDEIYMVSDASGGTTAEAHDMAMLRMVQAGVVPVTWQQVLLAGAGSGALIYFVQRRTRRALSGIGSRYSICHHHEGAIMLKNMNATATVGVRDIAAAREFYGKVLELSPVNDEGDSAEIVLYGSGNTQVLVYRSEYAGTNQATSITWDVGDKLTDIVAALKAKGVRFEHYDIEGMRREGDIHIADKMKVVWLKDPDGNILNINGS